MLPAGWGGCAVCIGLQLRRLTPGASRACEAAGTRFSSQDDPNNNIHPRVENVPTHIWSTEGLLYYYTSYEFFCAKRLHHRLALKYDTGLILFSNV